MCFHWQSSTVWDWHVPLFLSRRCPWRDWEPFFVVRFIPQYLFTSSFHISPTHSPFPPVENKNIKTGSAFCESPWPFRRTQDLGSGKSKGMRRWKVIQNYQSESFTNWQASGVLQWAASWRETGSPWRCVTPKNLPFFWTCKLISKNSDHQRIQKKTKPVSSVGHLIECLQ